MSPAGQQLWSIVRAARRRVRVEGVVALVASAGAVISAGLVAAWFVVGSGWWSSPGPAPLVLELVLAIALTALAVVGWRAWVRGIGDPQIAAAAETGRGLAPGSLRGVLELSRSLPPGTSAALFRRAELEMAIRLSGTEPRQLAGEMGRKATSRRRRAVGWLTVGAGLVAALGFVSPDRSRSAWTPLLQPVAHLTPPPLPPMTIDPGDAEIERGRDLSLRIGAPGRSMVVVRWRAAGDVPRQRQLDVRADEATTAIGPIDAPMIYWVVSPDGAVSDTFRVTPRDPLLVSELIVDVVYPRYLDRGSERFEGEIPPLQIPAGSRIEIRGQTTQPLAGARLQAAEGDSGITLAVDGARFSIGWTPASSGVYRWRMTGLDGGAPSSLPEPLELRVVPDHPPEVEIRYPGRDTVLGRGMNQPIVAHARDDHGLVSAELVSWRVSMAGRRDAEVVTPFPPLDGDPERAVLRTVLEAADREILPGDTLFYFVRVQDNAPQGQVAVSRTYRLRLPSLGELRQQVRDEARDLVRDTEQLARSNRELQRETRDLARRSARTAQTRADQVSRGGARAGEQRGGQRLEYGEAERARQMLDRQESMVERAAELQQRIDAFDRNLESAGARDAEMQRRMRELQELYAEILSPALKERLEELREALDRLDPAAVQEALERLAEEQADFRDQLERSLEMLRRTALEQEMGSTAQEARELASLQEALADAIDDEQRVTESRVAQQDDLKSRADSLSAALEAMRQRLEDAGEREAAEQAARAAEQLRQAQSNMDQAGRHARQDQASEAGEQGREAAARLNEAAESLDTGRQEMTDAWQQEVQETLQQSTLDVLKLAERQQSLLEEMRQAQESGTSPPEHAANMRQENQGQAGGDSGQQQQDGRQGDQGGQQQGGQQQGGQQQGGQQQSGQQQSGQQQGGQQQGGQQQGGQQQGGQQGRDGQGQQQGQDGGGAGGDTGGQGQNWLDQMRSEQVALREGLEAVGRNLSETGQSSALLNRDVSTSMGRAMVDMQQTLEQLHGRDAGRQMPLRQAEQSVESLNRLALALLASGHEGGEAQGGTGTQEMLDALAELGREQAGLNADTRSTVPLDLTPQAMSRQMERLGQRQQQIASRLQGMSNMSGTREDILGRLEHLIEEAQALAQELRGGRLTPELLERQERLFHRLLDAGRTLERDEVSEERVSERPGAYEPSIPPDLDARLLEAGPRYPVPSPEDLRHLSPAYRRLILEYFDRLNRDGPSDDGAASDVGAGGEAR